MSPSLLCSEEKVEGDGWGIVGPCQEGAAGVARSWGSGWFAPFDSAKFL